MNNLKAKTRTMGTFTHGLPVLPSLSLVVLMLLSSFAYANQSVIGEVIFAQGDTTFKEVDESSRALKVDDEVKLTDLIKTEEDSVLIISFIDGAKVTLRPNSTLYIKQYTEIEATLSLVRGGARVIAGEIARRVPASFRVITPDGDVTAQNRDSVFTVRVCTQDCNEENIKLAPSTKPDLPVVARIVALQGSVEASSEPNSQSGTAKRSLAIGNLVYNAETLVSDEDSYAQLQFKDGSSVSIQAESSVHINDYKFNETGFEDRSIFSLVQGGLRYVTGLMGKKDRTTFRLNTYAATMGIRGTDFSVNCIGDCSTGGIATHVYEGAISIQNKTGLYISTERSYSTVKDQQSTPIIYTESPVTFDNNIAPTPSDALVNTENLFTISDEWIEPGTHVSVEAGVISIVSPSDDPPVFVSENLAVSVESTGSVSSHGTPSSFQTMDPFFSLSSNLVGGSINTIRIGGSGSSADTVSGAAAVATAVIQEQTIASPY